MKTNHYASERQAVKHLSSEYHALYKRLVRMLRADVEPGPELELALSSILELLLEASQEQRLAAELFPEGIDAFYRDLLETLPVYSSAKTEAKRKQKRIVWSIAAVVLALTVVWGICGQIGYTDMWRRGIAYMAGSLDKYSYHHTTLDGEYEVDIDLSDLNSNKGKIVYDHDGLRIVVDSVDMAGLWGGGFRIHFRSHGKYSLDRAVLVSGSKHYSTEARWFSSSLEAELRSEYKGQIYQGSVMGISGLNYKDGDMFSFYLFPAEAYQDNQIPLEGEGTVKVTLSGLSRNEWLRK